MKANDELLLAIAAVGSMSPLTRDLFVSNALWMAVGFSTQGANLGEPLYRGNFRHGDASCNNGQGDDFLARWDEWRDPEVHLGSLGALMDAFLGPSLLETYGPTSPLERRLFDALARDELVLSRELGLALMGSQSIRDDVRCGRRPAAKSAQRIADSLAHLGFIWPDFEAHLAEAWPASAASGA